MLNANQVEQIKILYHSSDKIGYRTVAKKYGVSWKVIWNIINKDTYRPVPEERFWSKVNKRGPNECWPWNAARNKAGYGIIGWNKKVVEASRIAYILTYGDPGKLHVLHSCDNRWCCNPAHLRSGTHQENMQDMVIRKRARNGATGKL